MAARILIAIWRLIFGSSLELQACSDVISCCPSSSWGFSLPFDMSERLTGWYRGRRDMVGLSMIGFFSVVGSLQSKPFLIPDAAIFLGGPIGGGVLCFSLHR